MVQAQEDRDRFTFNVDFNMSILDTSHTSPPVVGPVAAVVVAVVLALVVVAALVAVVVVFFLSLAPSRSNVR